MQWLIVVVFATLTGDVYIFEKPTFDTYDECIGSVTDPEQAPRYVMKLLEEYGRPMPIKSLDCMDEDTIDQILNQLNSVKT